MAVPQKTIRFQRTRGGVPRIRALGQTWAPYEDLYHYVLTRTWSQFFLLVGAAFLGANALFALAYTCAPGSIANEAHPGSFEDAFFFSVQTLATIGYGAMAPATLLGHAIVTVEALTGMVGMALVTGMTFAKFARPTARVLFTDKLVIAERNGEPHLMFRMANWRHNQVVEAQLRATLLVTERTREGEMLRRPVDLPLVRDRTAFFGLTWTAMHRIDAASPFSGEGAVEKLRAVNAELYLSLSGLDDTIGQTIHARHAYALDDIVPNARFADVLSVLEDGTRVIDYHQFHVLIPTAPSSAPTATPAPSA